MRYYKITRQEAELIGEFFYLENQKFSPFVGEQVDGSYVISEELYNSLRNNTNILKVDFSQKSLYEYNDLLFKVIVLG